MVCPTCNIPLSPRDNGCSRCGKYFNAQTGPAAPSVTATEPAVAAPLLSTPDTPWAQPTTAAVPPHGDWTPQTIATAPVGSRDTLADPYAEPKPSAGAVIGRLCLVALGTIVAVSVLVRICAFLFLPAVPHRDPNALPYPPSAVYTIQSNGPAPYANGQAPTNYRPGTPVVSNAPSQPWRPVTSTGPGMPLSMPQDRYNPQTADPNQMPGNSGINAQAPGNPQEQAYGQPPAGNQVTTPQQMIPGQSAVSNQGNNPVQGQGQGQGQIDNAATNQPNNQIPNTNQTTVPATVPAKDSPPVTPAGAPGTNH